MCWKKNTGHHIATLEEGPFAEKINYRQVYIQTPSEQEHEYHVRMKFK